MDLTGVHPVKYFAEISAVDLTGVHPVKYQYISEAHLIGEPDISDALTFLTSQLPNIPTSIFSLWPFSYLKIAKIGNLL